jgi:hypothetical protein
MLNEELLLVLMCEGAIFIVENYKVSEDKLNLLWILSTFGGAFEN